MNKFSVLLLLLGCYINSYAVPPTPPLLTLSQQGLETTVQWTAVENATGYTLYYAPYPKGEPIGQIDMGNHTRFSAGLPENSAYYVATKAYNPEGRSDYSNIDFLVLPPFAPATHNSLVDDRVGGWNGGSSGGPNYFSPLVGNFGEFGNDQNYLRVSACQTTGLVYREVTSRSYQMKVIDYGNGSTMTMPASEPTPPGQTATLVPRYEVAQSALVYYEVNRAGQATKTQLTVLEDALEPTWSLTFDSGCNPHLLRLTKNQYEHWQRKGGLWVKNDLFLDLSALGDISYIQHGTALLGQDNRIHLLFNVTLTNNSKRFVDAVLLHNDWQGGVWQTKFVNALLTTESWGGNQTLDYAVDKQGVVHVVYALEIEGVKRNLQYAQLTQDTWQTEVVLLGEDVIGQGFTTVARNASLALDNNGQPAIASTFVRHVDTGSYQYAHLLYHTRVNGQWQNQIVVQDSDNYAGTDGTTFTGDNPYLVFDQNNLPHIVFNDIASWHNSRGENDKIPGQLRYATLTPSGTWTVETIVKQAGQSLSPNPLNGFISPSIGLANDGQRLVFAGVEFSTASTSVTYLTSDIAVNYRVQMILRELAK
jgi:hypothetical protein